MEVVNHTFISKINKMNWAQTLVFLADLVRWRFLFRANSAFRVRGLVKLLAARAIELLVGAFVDIARLRVGDQKRFNTAPVPRVATGPDEIVDTQVQGGLEPLGIAAYEVDHRQAGQFGGQYILRTVFVGARLETDIVALQPVEPGKTVRLDHFQRENDMRARV